MKILLSLIIGLFSSMFNNSCSVSEAGGIRTKNEYHPGYEVVVEIINQDNCFDRIMDAFIISGLRVSSIRHLIYSTDRQDITVMVVNGDGKLLTEVETRLRAVLNVEGIGIRRL